MCYIDPLGRPTIEAGSDNYFCTCPYVRNFKSSKTKQNIDCFWRDYGSGRVDHWWLLSCKYSFLTVSSASGPSREVVPMRGAGRAVTHGVPGPLPSEQALAAGVGAMSVTRLCKYQIYWKVIDPPGHRRIGGHYFHTCCKTKLALQRTPCVKMTGCLWPGGSSKIRLTCLMYLRH